MDSDRLFKRLDVQLSENIDYQYFSEPREFRSLIEVLTVLNERVELIQLKHGNDSLHAAFKEKNPAHIRLQQQLQIVNDAIDDVVGFQHGGLNNSLDTMIEVAKEYSRGRNEIQALRQSLDETQKVLTAKKSGQISLRELWSKKVELQESLRIVKDLEELMNYPLKVQRMIQQKRYLSAVTSLNYAIQKMFGDDLVNIGGLTNVRDQIMDLKETLLFTCGDELRSSILGNIDSNALQSLFASHGGLSLEDAATEEEYYSETGTTVGGGGGYHDTASQFGGTRYNDDKSVFSLSSNSISSPIPRPGTVSNGITPHGIAASVLGSPNGNGTPTMNNNTTHAQHTLTSWSLDLLDIDDTMEANAILDPVESKTTFLRILVKTIGILQCEEDMERIILDNLEKSFVSNLLIPARKTVLERLHTFARDYPSSMPRNEHEEVQFYGNVFKAYASLLIDNLYEIIHKLFYVLTLLYKSRQVMISKLRAGSMDGLHPGNSPITPPTPSPSNNIADWNIFLPNVEDLAATRRKELIISLWQRIESLVLQEITKHLKEMAVENISDHQYVVNNAYLSAIQRVEGALADDEEDGFDDEYDGGMDYLSSPGRIAARKGFGTPGGGKGGNGNSGHHDMEKTLFPPSSRYAATIYTKVVLYHTKMMKLLKEFGYYDAAYWIAMKQQQPMTTSSSRQSAAALLPAQVIQQQFQHLASSITGGMKGGKQPTSTTKSNNSNNSNNSVHHHTILHSGSNKTGTVSIDIEEITNEFTSLYSTLHHFIEDELVPVMQSSINMQMNELVMNTELFTTLSSSTLFAPTATGGGNMTGNTAAVSTTTSLLQELIVPNLPPPTIATERVYYMTISLYRYWSQLYQHREMVEVVLDRLVRNYLSTAKETKEFGMFSWYFTTTGENNKQFLKVFFDVLSKDSLVSTWYTRLYQGKSSVEELFGLGNSTGGGVGGGMGSNNTGTGGGSTRNRDRVSSSTSTLSNTTMLAFNTTQGYLQEMRYDFPSLDINKVLQDSEQMKMMAMVANGAEWLIKHLIRMYFVTMKSPDYLESAHVDQFTTNMMGTNTNAGNASGGGSMNGGSGNTTQSDAQRFATSLVAVIKDVGRFSLEILTIFRANMQVLSYFYMEKLTTRLVSTHLVMPPTPTITSSGTGMNGSAGGGGGGGMSGLSSMMHFASFGGGNHNQSSHTNTNYTNTNSNHSNTNYTNSNSNSNSTNHSNSHNNTNSNTMNSTSEEMLITSYMQHLHNILDTYAPILSSTSFLLIFAPVSVYTSRYFLFAFVQSILTAGTQNPNSPAMDMTGGNNGMSSMTNNNNSMASKSKQMKSKAFQYIISLQQQLATCYAQYVPQTEYDMRKRLMEGMSDEFERLRRFVSLLDVSSNELKTYFTNFPEEFTTLEMKALWLRCSDQKLSSS